MRHKLEKPAKKWMKIIIILNFTIIVRVFLRIKGDFLMSFLKSRLLKFIAVIKKE